jgi:tetratricopeptide (TPR) repeat protein
MPLNALSSFWGDYRVINLSMTKKNTYSKNYFNKYRDIFFCLFLVICTLSVYWRVNNYDFVNFDDKEYVYDNRYVQGGLTLENITWALSFTDKVGTYWHPIAWLSHMLDCQLYGLDAGKHHLTSLMFHIANSLLLFLVFKLMTGSFCRSAAVAMFFAIHPVNVDTVAWIAERKNVLSTFFWILTMLTYIYYCQQPSFYRYIPILLFFSFGLMTKPMIVTLPCVLLLLDYWPLGRFSHTRLNGNSFRESVKAALPNSRPFTPFQLLLEKIPLFALAALSISLALLSVKDHDNVIPTALVPMMLRIANALVSYVKYIGKMILPMDLAVIYPYPDMVPMWKTIGSLMLLVFISVFIIRSIRKAPYLTIGWLWYLGTLVPVLGLVQAGHWPAMADRFAYVPFIGLYIIVAWGIPELFKRWHHVKRSLPIIATAILFVFMIITFFQVGYWKNSITLFKHALAVTTNNYVPHNNLGLALQAQGRLDDAINHYEESLQIRPENERTYINLGVALKEKGRTDDAIKHYLEALRIKPDSEEAHYNLANALKDKGRLDDAIKHYVEALRINPEDEKAHVNLGFALQAQGRLDDAIKHYVEALRINPEDEKAHNNLAIALIYKGDLDAAIIHFRKALQINPNYINAKKNLNRVLIQQKQRQ